MSQVVIGTAGHIDHGKTALVKALTGTDTDRLAEEKSRGMTIDLGFAFLTDDITIIDVPGHEKFIRNMVAGVSTIQIALFVIAADDGVMPQTREHLQILSLLNIPKGVIALTKTDLVKEDWIKLVEEDIRELCNDTFLESAQIIRTSMVTESGIEELKTTLIENAKEVQEKLDRGFFRLQVDRNFSKTGFGTVVTGTVVSGELKKGDEIEILPIGELGRVRGLQSHGKQVEVVKLGDRAAVNLVGIEKNELWRGVEIATPGWLNSTERVIANVTLIPDTKWIIKSNQRIRVHIGTQEVLARIITLKSRLKSGDSANVIIIFEKPVVAAMDDRFVIRSYSPLDTIGGGIILDTYPSGSVKKQKEWAEELSIDSEQRYLQFIQREVNNPLTLDEWQKIFLVSTKKIKGIIQENKLKTTKGKPLIYSNKNLEKSKSVIINILQNFHENNQTQSSMKGEELKKKSKFSSIWFDFVSAELSKSNEVSIKNSVYSLSNYSVELSDKDQNVIDKIMNIFDNYDLEPVAVDMIAKELNLPIKKILELLYVAKALDDVIKISDNLWTSGTALKSVKSELTDYFSKNKELSVVNFKDLTGLTRKTAIPYLEYLDSSGLTIRDENVRIKGKEL